MPALLVRPMPPYMNRIKPANQVITPDQAIIMDRAIAPAAMETKNSKVENAFAMRCIYSRNVPT